jgi:ribosomal-protein-alanine N-acetyltransferase
MHGWRGVKSGPIQPDTSSLNIVRRHDMQVTLHQLNVSELAAILEQGTSFSAPGFVHQGALPPQFVVRRALEMITAGEPEQWWSPFLVLEGAERAIAGGCAFKGQPKSGRVEVLYGVSKDCRGRGIAAAAVRALAAVAFAHGAVEVLAEIEPHNVASIRVVEACGFERLSERLAEDGKVVGQWLFVRTGA